MEEPTATGIKKKRLSLACNVCRRKKIRCDGVKPTCGKCERFRQECSYTSTMKKRGPRQGHIELLEQRLKKMEELMTAGSTTPIATHPTTNNSNSNGSSDTTTSRLPPILSSGGIPTNTPQLGYQVIPQRAMPTCYTPTTQLPPMTTNMASDLPSDDIVDHLVDLFFKHCATISPIFDIAGFKKSVLNKTCNQFLLLCVMAVAARFSKRPDIMESPVWMSGEKYAIKARAMMEKVIESGCLEHAQGFLMLTVHEYGCGRGNRCWAYTGISVRMSLEIGLHKEMIFEEPSGSVLDLDRWYWYETRRRTFWDAFMHDKFASASTGRPIVLDPLDCETMLSVDYNVLDLETSDDFYQCSLNNSKLVHYHIIRDAMGQITGIQCNHMNPESPEHKLYLKKVGWDSHIIREAVILGKVTQLVNRGYKIEDGIYGPYKEESDFEKLDKELDKWADALPLQIRNTPANLEHFREMNSEYRSAKFLLGHVLHNSLVVLLNRPSLVIADMPALGQVTQEVQDRVHKSMDKCLAAADNVTVMLKDLCCQIDVIPPFITYLVYTTATVMVNSSFSVNPVESQKAKTALNEYFRFLAEMRVYWAMADKLYTMIHDLYTVHQKVVGMNQNCLSSISPTTESSSAATSWENSNSGSNSELTTTTTTTGPSLDNIYPYPCSAAIPIRKLPMAEVSMSTSDYTLDQALNYNSSYISNATTTTTTTAPNDVNNTSNTGFLQNMRSRSLFNDQSLSPFDLWIQQQQQAKKPS